MTKSELIIECAKLFITILAVALAAWFAYIKYLKENDDKRDLMVNVVFGDLTNIYQHYTYTKSEISMSLISDKEKKIRLKYSKFGPLKCLEKIDQLGNLSSHQIRLLLQLNLRIRNTDMLLDYFSDSNVTLTEKEILELERRMLLCMHSSKEIIDDILKIRKDLERDFRNVL